ncbi:uncharacterized protein LOC134459511 [Engraulis encrasicolus]|uniref:uncharacterized protein LOC134459511 n=1 Tax=Engraulis encrasicolus TaxID=184585 RepID=UPI002FD6A71C
MVRVPQNCPRTYKLITFDPDNDQGRCRYGQDPLFVECASCQIPAGFALNQTRIDEKLLYFDMYIQLVFLCVFFQDFCTLSYSTASTGVYGLEVVVEDFPRQTITLSYRNSASTIRDPYGPGKTALSQIPLHFAVKVEPAIASCEEGVYLPKFIAPTPANGETIYAVINQELEIIVNTTASASSIHDLIISGPFNITVNSYGNSTTQFVLRWTPRTEDLGEYFPVCFVAESNQSSFFYQSDMRCVLVEVGNGTDSGSSVPVGETTNFVVGVSMMVRSTLNLTEANQTQTFLRQFKEELVKRGLSNSTSVRLRKVEQVEQAEP